jgi:hypothetical protein
MFKKTWELNKAIILCYEQQKIMFYNKEFVG